MSSGGLYSDLHWPGDYIILQLKPLTGQGLELQTHKCETFTSFVDCTSDFRAITSGLKEEG